MANTPANLMVWLGDNWYLPNKIENSEILWEGANYARGQAVMRPLLQAIPHYATWDDHDFGPNNSDKNFKFKKQSREAFMDFWANPSYGNGKDGIYTSFSYGDVNFYLLDDRWWRSSDREPAYTGLRRKINQKKRMFGKSQLNWLKDELIASKASFNIIVTGSQVLNSYTKYDCLYHFPVEYDELMSFLQDNKVNGVIFFTGDRHHSEIVRQTRDGHYTLYDVTVSPFTSGTHKVGKEANNPQRVQGTLIDEKQNFAKVSISGDEGNRKLHIEFLGVKGQKLAEWEVNQRDVSYSK
jgi:alkaline phosphatase D